MYNPINSFHLGQCYGFKVGKMYNNAKYCRVKSGIEGKAVQGRANV